MNQLKTLADKETVVNTNGKRQIQKAQIDKVNYTIEYVSGASPKSQLADIDEPKNEMPTQGEFVKREFI